MFGLKYISVKAMLKDQIQKDPENGKVITECIDTGEVIPDHIVNPLIEKRLKESDCRVNGWVLEGFGYTKS